MTPATIATVGSLNMDIVVRVDRLPRPGETVLGGPYQTFAGGKGANQAVAAALAGGRSQMQGAIGSDAFGEQLMDALQQAGVDTRGAIRVDGPSGIATIAIDTKGENAIVVSPGANARFQPDCLDAATIQTADILLLQLEIPLTTVEAAIAIAIAADVPVLLNPAPIQALPDRLLHQIRYLVVNETEAASLTQIPLTEIDSPETALRAARQLRERGVAVAIVTLGKGGVVWSADETEAWLPALPVEVVDTTAAGDGFCGALAVALAEGMELGDAIALANGAGAIAVTRAGAQPSLGTRTEILAILQQHPASPRPFS